MLTTYPSEKISIVLYLLIQVNTEQNKGGRKEKLISVKDKHVRQFKKIGFINILNDQNC